MVEKVVCGSPDEFDAKLSASEEIAQGKPVFVLFTGTKSQSTGMSWCPDCVRADPVIHSALEQVTGGCVLLECTVDREPYRKPDYPYRIDSKIRLTCVPTLMKWANGKALARLNDSQSQVAELVQELIEA